LSIPILQPFSVPTTDVDGDNGQQNKLPSYLLWLYYLLSILSAVTCLLCSCTVNVTVWKVRRHGKQAYTGQFFYMGWSDLARKIFRQRPKHCSP